MQALVCPEMTEGSLGDKSWLKEANGEEVRRKSMQNADCVGAFLRKLKTKLSALRKLIRHSVNKA